MNVTSYFNRQAFFVLATMAGAGFASSAMAQEKVLFDFGDNNSFRGVSTVSPDQNGNDWNNIHTGAFFVNLVDTTGAGSGINFGFSSGVATDSFNGPAGDTTTGGGPASHVNDFTLSPSLGDLAVNTAAIDYVASPGAFQSCEFQIQGLDPTKTYTLTFFGSHEFSDDATTTYTAYSDPLFQDAIASTNLNVQDPAHPNLANLSNTATLSNLVPQLNNILYIDLIGADGQSTGYLNSMELTVNSVPEPTSLVIAAGGLFFGLRRRR